MSISARPACRRRRRAGARRDAVEEATVEEQQAVLPGPAELRSVYRANIFRYRLHKIVITKLSSLNNGIFPGPAEPAALVEVRVIHALGLGDSKDTA